MTGSAKLTCIVLIACFQLPQAVSAQESKTDTNQEATKPLGDMTPEERRVVIDAMSDEERAALKAKNKAAMDKRRAEWQAMTPAERQAKRKELQERREAMTPEEREAMGQRREAAKQRQKDKQSKRPPDAQQDPPL